MAHTVQTRTLMETRRDIVVQVSIVGDGASGELSAQTVMAVASCAANPGDNLKPTRFTVRRVWHDGDPSISVLLLFDANTDQVAWLMGSSSNNELSFEDIGGIPDPKATGFTGTVLFTTLGLATSAKRFTFIVRLRKEYD